MSQFPNPATMFRPGEAPKPRNGTRPKLATRFFKDLYAVWEEQGDAALRRLAFHDPGKLVAIVAHLMPQKVEITTPTDGISDDRMEQLIALAEAMAARPRAGELADGVGGVIEGQAIELETGGGGPPALGPSGEGLRGLSQTALSENRQSPILAGTPEKGPLPDPVASLLQEDDVDPASLF